MIYLSCDAVFISLVMRSPVCDVLSAERGLILETPRIALTTSRCAQVMMNLLYDSVVDTFR
jgi:hypothetical protein